MAKNLGKLLFVCLCLRTATGQFGFFPNQRDDRHYGNPSFEFAQNFGRDRPNLRTTLSGLLQFGSRRYDRNREYTYPGQHGPQVINNDGYNQFGQYGLQRPDYYNNPYNQDRQNIPYPNYNTPVRFPSTDLQAPPYSDNDQSLYIPDYTDQNNQYNYSETNQGNARPVTFPEHNGPNDKPTFDYNNGGSHQGPNVDHTTLPPLTPVPAVPPSDSNTGFPLFNNGGSNQGPSVDHTTLTPLTPVPAIPPSDSNVGFPLFNNGGSNQGPSVDHNTLPPLTPVPAIPPSDSNTGFPLFNTGGSNQGPNGDHTTLPPLTPVPVPPSDSNTGFPLFNNGGSYQGPNVNHTTLPPLNPVPAVPGSDSNTGFPTFKPQPETQFPTFKPVPSQEQNAQNQTDAHASEKEPKGLPLDDIFNLEKDRPLPPLKPATEVAVPDVSEVSPASEISTLPPLTPASPSESRNNFNPFQATCETPEGGAGSCVSLLDCEPYIKLLQQSRSDPSLVQVLRRAHCGFEGNNPKVCCPRPEFPPIPETTTTTTTTPAPYSPPVTPEEKTGEDLTTGFAEPPVCGFSNASFSRVVGGVDAKLGDFPWMALLGYKRKTDTRWLCGGSLVTSKYVLTASHCIHGHESTLYVVRLGELDLSRTDEGATPVDVLIKEQIKHEEYSPNSFTNDIGLLLLDRDVQFTDLIKPICIPRTSELRSNSFENYNPIIAGWGDLEFRGPKSEKLQALQLPVVSNDYCAQAYSAYKAQKIDERVLCAGYKKGGKDACQGDSGGPLMQPIWDRSTLKTYFYQIGVVSFGKKCAEAGFPGVYTRVTNFVPWLEKKILGTA